MTGQSPNFQTHAFDRQLNVAVLMGGIGPERQVSLQSGRCVAQALREAGLNVTTADITPDNMEILDDSDIDVFFVALHGQFGEDGRLQKILEDKGLVYTGSGPTASRLAFDKLASKKLFAQAGIAVPEVIEFTPDTAPSRLDRDILRLGDLFVVKPVAQGSSVGVSIVSGPQQAVSAARKTWEQFGNCMIERYIAGRELTVGILSGRELPIIEIKSRTGFYDYHAKYVDDQTEYLFDTIEDDCLVAGISQAALNCFDSLGCRDFARVDFILGDDGVPYVLEVNTIPGFTNHSLLPKAAAKAGLSMSNLCLMIVEAALTNAQSAVRQ